MRCISVIPTPDSIAIKQSFICPLYVYLDLETASLEAIAATIDIQMDIFKGDVDAKANNGVRRNTPMIISCIDIRLAALIVFDD